jgi:hypothetical protein
VCHKTDGNDANDANDGNGHNPRMAIRVAWIPIVLVTVACADHLPEQDLRILSARPAAKLSASDLWKDFQTDATAARRRYFGQAIDVSDAPTAVEPQAPGGARIVFGQSGERGVIARLLDERAAETAKDAKAGARMTLRCFCEGLDEQKDVLLKSCIRP